MSVWKKLNKQDAFVTTYVAKKTWNLQGNQLEGLGVKFLPAYSTFNVVEETKDLASCTILSGSFDGEQESISTAQIYYLMELIHVILIYK